MNPLLGPRILSEEEKYMQQQLLLEKDLNNLRREYTILDKDRSRTQMYGVPKLMKAEKIISIFSKEHQEILTNLAVAKGRKREDARRFDVLNTYLAEHDFFDNAINAQKEYMTELREQIKKVKKNVQELNKSMISDDQHQERVRNAMKTHEALENKLEVQMKQFNLICAKNKQLRLEIDHLLWTRRNFLTIWNKLLLKLCAGKKIMLDLIEQATIAYDQREEWCNKLQALRIQGHADILINIETMRDYRMREDHFKKMVEFFDVKGKKRVMKDLIHRQREKRAEQRKKMEEKLEEYRLMVSDIKTFTREQTVDSISSKFLLQESENFMHFKYINDMIGEMESVNDYMEDLHCKIHNQNLLQEERAVQQRLKICALEEQLEIVTSEREDSENQMNSINKTLEKMLKGIWSLFKLCRCNQDVLLQLLGDNTKVAPYNALLYLEILEKKVHEYLVNVHHKDKILLDKKKIEPNKTVISLDKVDDRVHPVEKLAPSSPCVLCVEHELVGDVFDSLQHVWSREIAKANLRRRMLLPEGPAVIHNVSRCHLPKSRKILQKRYE